MATCGLRDLRVGISLPSSAPTMECNAAWCSSISFFGDGGVRVPGALRPAEAEIFLGELGVHLQ